MPLKKTGPKKKPSLHRQIQCRNNQRRYRAEARARMEYLENAVGELLTETARLEGHVESLSRAVMLLPPPRSVIAHLGNVARCREYWIAFQHGYAVHDPRVAARQVAVLRSLMDPCVEVMGVYGIEKVVDNWTQYARCFKTLLKVSSGWEVVHVDDGTRIVKGVGTITLRIGRETIGALCPQTLGNEPLVQRIVGREIVCPCTQFFYMSLVQDRVVVTRVDTDLNMMVGLTSLLGSLPDATNIMTGVRLKDGAELTCWLPPPLL
ncbi:hypothetical protein ACHHYP_06860 [Achlya hypogyna]|uniref:Bzip transcription factor n=1 Tax=Achlya hypogyna TaxID=1202772 RepID=A0A1V9YRB7_ACHHY|nr:hypothetical protein ACHHYP_06860 [Achlya hypogyna]